MTKTRVCALLCAFCLCLTGCGALNFHSAEAPEIVSWDGSSIGDRTPNCTANPELADALRAAIMEARNTTVQGWDLDLITVCLDELMAVPDYFWFRGYHVEATTGLRTTAEVTFTWLYPDGPARYQEMCRRADEVLAAAPADGGDYAVALYLYDWLARTVTYTENDDYDQAAYAAICEGGAVCGGIADAYAFLLTRAGIPACTVTGTAVREGEQVTHAWNYAELDGAVYAFDPTWDNTDRLDAAGREYVLHDWFAVTSDEMHTAHEPKRAEDDIVAVSNADNYFVRENALITDDSLGAVSAALQPQVSAGQNALTLRCASRQIYESICFRLFELQEIRVVLKQLGLFTGGSYELAYTQQDDLFIVTLLV